ncbi:MAG: phosphotransferase [Myxococcales bacterium]|nr:phosphotransferase [Myxococcales bacterium]
MELPKEVEDVTADWLTAALREGGALPQGEVKSVTAERIAVGVGLMGRLARLSVEYDDAADDAPASIIFKYPIDAPMNRQIADAYRFYKRECDFYSRAAADSPLRTARCYFQQCNENLDFVLLLEDLGAARPGDQIAGNGPEDAEHAIAQLAKHHARFWGKTGDMDYLINADDPVVLQVLKQSTTMACPVMLEAYPELMTPELSDLARSVCEYGNVSLQRVMDMPLTLVHGDFRADNLFFEGLPGGDDLAVIDWQICHRGHGPFDVAYHLTQSITPETRRAIERPTLELYHRTLVDNGVEGYSFDDLWEYYREAALYGLVYPITVCGALDMSEPRARGLGQVFLERSLSAITDLNAAEKLGLWT